MASYISSCQDSPVDDGVSAVCMLFTSSLVALVGRGERADNDQLRLRLWNTSTRSPVLLFIMLYSRHCIHQYC